MIHFLRPPRKIEVKKVQKKKSIYPVSIVVHYRFDHRRIYLTLKKEIQYNTIHVVQLDLVKTPDVRRKTKQVHFTFHQALKLGKSKVNE